MEIIFRSPVYLWFFLSLPLFVILHFFVQKYMKKRALEFANFAALERVAKKPKLSRNLLLLFVRIVMLSSLIFAVAGTTIWYFGKSSDFDFVLAIDTSSSMLSDDFKPNRLEAAKKTALDFLDSIKSKVKVGLVSFAGTSYVEQRPTNKIDNVREALNRISVKPIGGTDLGEAIITSVNLLLVEEKAKVVILLTDGRSNVGVPPSEGIKYANNNHVIIHTIGVGTEEGGIFSEANVTLTLEEEELKEIAEKTNGKYFRATDQETLSNAYEEIASVTKQKLSIDLSVYLMLLALGSLVIDWGLINTKYSVIP